MLLSAINSSSDTSLTPRELRQCIYRRENPFESEMLDEDAHIAEMKEILSYRYGDKTGFLVSSDTIDLLKETSDSILKRFSRLPNVDKHQLMNANERATAIWCIQKYQDDNAPYYMPETLKNIHRRLDELYAKYFGKRALRDRIKTERRRGLR